MGNNISALWKYLFKPLGVVLAFALILVAALSWSKFGRDQLASLASSLASSKEQSIQITGIDGIWSGEFLLDKVAISDANGQWLSVSDVAVSWSPTKLFSGVFDANIISVGNVKVTRSPLPTKSSSEDSGQLPVSIDIQKLEIGELILGEELVGKRSRLAVSGNFGFEPAPMFIKSEIVAEHIDDISGSLNLAVQYEPEMKNAYLQFSLAEAANGILANLLELKNGPAVTMEITGDGPPDNWKIGAFAKLNQQQVLKIGGNLSVKDDGQKLVLKGNGEPSELLPPKYRKLIGDSFDLNLDIDHQNSGKLAISSARLDFDQFFVSAKGSYDPGGKNNLTGGISAKGDAFHISEGVLAGMPDIQAKSIAFSISGDGEKANLKTWLDIPGINTPELRLAGIRAYLNAPEFDLQNVSGQFKVEATTQSVVSQNSDLQRLLSGVQDVEIRGRASQDSLEVEQFTFANPGVQAGMDASYAFEDGDWKANLKATVQPGAIPRQVTGLVDTPLKVSAKLIGGGSNIDLRDLSVAGGEIKARGDVSHKDEVIEGKIDMEVGNLRGLVEGLDMPLVAQLAFEGALDAPTIDLRLESDALRYHTHHGKDLSLRLEGIASASSPVIQMTLNGNLEDQDISAGLKLHTLDGQQVLEGLKIATGENQISGKLLLDDNFIPEGTINIDLPDVAVPALLALQEMSGDLAGKAVFSRLNGAANLEIKLRSDRLVREEVSASNIDISVAVSDYLNAPKPVGTITVGTVTSGGTVVNGLQSAFNQQQEWTNFDVQTNINNVPLDFAGRVRAGTQVDIELQKAKAKVQSIDVALAQPALIQKIGDVVKIGKTVLGIGKGRVTVSGEVADNLNIVSEISNLDAGLVNQFAKDLGMSGLVGGSVNVSGPVSAPKIDYNLQLQKLATKQTREFGVSALNVKSLGKFANNALNYDSSVSNPSGLRLDGGGKITLGSVVSMNLGYKGKIPFKLLASQLNAQGIALSGDALADIKISGSSDNPKIGGIITSSGARLLHAESGIAINALAMDVALAEDTIRIKNISGDLSTGGRINASGNIGIKAGSNFPADLELKVSNGVLTDHKSVNSNFDADLKLAGPLVADPLISGIVTLKRTTITIPDRLPSSIAKLDVVHKNANSEVSKQNATIKPSASSSGGGFRLNLSINAQNKIFIRGRGLDAELGGNLRLLNSTAAPRADGAFQIRRGRLSILGKRLNFTRGEAKFNGSFVPDLNMRAETQRDEYAIFIDVVGQADNPEFRFSSSPALAEDEVLARLIFGKDISSLSPVQLIKLGQAAATLTGYGGDSSTLDKIRSLVGADDLDVQTDEETGETKVGVGKYINDNTYVGVDSGTETGSGRVKIDLSIGGGVKLRGEAAQDGKNKAGIFYEKEY